MRTLVISDLHLGLGRRRAVLESPPAVERLLAALDGVGRLVLLGDALELATRPRERALAAGEPVLRAIGRRLGPDAEVVVVPGNHDRRLLGRWLRRHAGVLGLDTQVPADASPELARVVGWLAPARVSVRYPGVWLPGGVWASHGHYLNRHLVPDSAYGWLRARLGRPEPDSARPGDYEGRGRSREEDDEPFAPVRLARAAASLLHPKRVVGLFVDPRLAPLIAPLLSAQMQHASVPAMARVATRLGVAADYVIFGHVHRLGPRGEDSPAVWRGSEDGPALLNTGSWIFEPALLGGAQPPHPYWPGGAILIEDGEPPQAVGLLDDLDAEALRRR